MPSEHRKRRATSKIVLLNLGLFGKLGSANDFLRVSAAGEPFESFDRWLVEGIEWAHARGGEAWCRSFATGATYAFSFRPNRRQRFGPLLVGVLGPSADGAGRQFPLSVAAPYPSAEDSAVQPELLPIVFESLWQKSSDTLAVCSGLEASELAQHLGPVELEVCSLSEAERTYRDWTTRLSVSELWTLLFGDDYGQRPLLALQLLLEAVRPFRAVERPETPLTIWLPLGRAAGASVCVWLDLVRRLAGWRSTLPSFFWSHDGNDGKLLLHLGEPPESTLAELWLPSRSRDEMFDLSEQFEPSLVQQLPPLAPDVVEAMNAETISQLLGALETA